MIYNKIAFNSRGIVDVDACYAAVCYYLVNNGVAKATPKDGTAYKLDGTIQSWANLIMSMIDSESGFNTYASGDAGDFDGGSQGLLQLSRHDGQNYGFTTKPYTLAQLQDPVFNIDIATRIMARRLRINNTIRYGLGAYWGPIQRGELHVEDFSSRWAKGNTFQPS